MLKNINYLKNNNEKLIKEFNNLISSANISEIYDFSFNNFYNINGEKYIGEMKNGKKEGKGILYWNDGERYEGDWKNGKKEGKGIMYYKDGSKKEGIWKNGDLVKN